MRPKAILLVVVVVTSLSSARAQELPLLMSVSPLWTGRTRPEGLELESPDRSGWKLASSLSYGNTFRVSPEIVVLHESTLGAGAPPLVATVDAARELWPERDLYAVDAEIVRLDLEAAFSWSSGWFSGVRLPMVRMAGTGLDHWPSSWHDVFGIANAGRESFAEGETLVALRPESGELTYEDDRGWHLDQATIWGGREWNLGLRGSHRVWLSTAVAGSGAYLAHGCRGLGLRWAGTRNFARFAIFGGLGWTHHGGSAGGLGPTADTTHAWLGGGVELGRGVVAMILIRADGSPFREVDAGKAGRNTGEFAMGLGLPLGSHWNLRLSFGEDFPGMGLPPDFSIHSGLVWRPQQAIVE